MPAQVTPVQEVAPQAKAKASAKRAREGSPGEPKAKAKAGAGQRRAGSAGKMKTDEQKLKEMLVEYGKVSTQANTIIAKVTGGHDGWQKLNKDDFLKPFNLVHDRLVSKINENEFFSSLLMHGLEETRVKPQFTDNVQSLTQAALGLAENISMLKAQCTRLCQLSTLV